MLARRVLLRRLFAEIVGNDQAGDAAACSGDAMGAVDQVPDLRDVRRHLHVVRRDVLEQRDEVDLLLVVAAEAHPRLLPHDRQHRLVVELRVVEPVQEVDGARPGSGETDADLARPLRFRAGHERRHLLVAYLDELELVPVALERADDRIDPVAGIAVDASDAVLGETFQQEISSQLSHRTPICRSSYDEVGSRLVTAANT